MSRQHAVRTILLLALALSLAPSSTSWAQGGECYRCSRFSTCLAGWFCCALGCQMNPGCELIGAGGCNYAIERQIGKHLVSVRIYSGDQSLVDAILPGGEGIRIVNGMSGAGSKRIAIEATRLAGRSNGTLQAIKTLDVVGAALGRRIVTSDGDGFAFEAVPEAGRLKVTIRKLSRGDVVGTDGKETLGPGDALLTSIRIRGTTYVVSLHGLALQSGPDGASTAKAELERILADTEPASALDVAVIPVLSLSDRAAPDWAQISKE